MRMYLVALSAGVLVSIFYGLLDVRSPAPPVVALVGLLGMLVGEQVTPTARRLVTREPVTMEWMKTNGMPHMFGQLPRKASSATHVGDEVRT